MVLPPVRRGALLCFVGGLATVFGAALAAQNQQPAIESLKVQSDVYVVAGAGGNCTVQFGDDGVLVVDTGLADNADRLLAEIAHLSGNRTIRYVINTHDHPDHVGGNERFQRVGQAIMSGNVSFDIVRSGATVIAHENVLFRLSKGVGNAPPASDAALPTDTFFGLRDEVSFNNEAVELIHEPAAHTDGDVMVFFRKSDVIATGDIYVNTGYPMVDAAQGGTINGVIAGLNRIIEITVPHDKQEGGTMVVPGHGRIADEADVVEYRDMITIIRDRVQEMMKKGMTLAQIKAAGPTSDYDNRYGATSGFWTTEMFVDAIYRTLGGK
jgi:glyoxylase-like metal-dependent hydrolase (beta-lactamase superfamily II)